ncbi:hypothetical protein QJS04_geneDACA011752 [Acorus gramineus]|uniref:Transcription factor CBF/NF-Y/archaeal histone domain-containing protein n=1 Tax=Acorus gramineus TaxID=55184 RepID=A0AAV9BIJ1_ACOGR|nr:hypothetical protein QJS04_geneDACA011752 [Acorus gramineus]
MGKANGGGETSAAVPAAAVEELPRAIVRRVVKENLDRSSSREGEMTVHKEALIAFSESARIFIHYLSATANDICKESKRQTMNADDVLKALEEIEFPEFVGPLKASLEDFRQKNAAKRSGAKPKESNKKRKKEEKENPPAQEEENEDVVEEEDNDNDDNGDAHESEE